MPRGIHRIRTLLATLALALASVTIALAVVEVGLRLLRDPERFLPYHRDSVRIFYPSEEITPGIQGPSRFTTNSWGTRGPELQGETLRILTIGGSTTACTALDDEEAWPALLMQELNQRRSSNEQAWVTNSGVDGQHSHHHLMHALYLLPRLPRIDYVLIYAGLNDVGRWLYQEDYDPDALADPDLWASRIGEAFRVSAFTPAHWPFYKRLEIWKRGSILKERVRTYWTRQRGADAGRIVQDAELEWLREEQRKREERVKILVPRGKLETLPLALDEYSAVLRRITTLVRRVGAEPIFIAQAMQEQLLDPEERRRFWMGAINGGATYLRQEQMLELVGQFNGRMRDVAMERSVHFIDLPRLLAGETDLFHDSVHFNEHGARVMARVIAEDLEAGVLAAGKGARK